MGQVFRNSRPSKITVPTRAHPLARLVFELMKKTRTTYMELEFVSGLLRSTLKAWRNANVPSLTSIEAALGVFGWRLVPCPPLDTLPADVREKLEEVGQHFRSDDETFAAAIAAAMTSPHARGSAETPAPRLDYDARTWPELAAA